MEHEFEKLPPGSKRERILLFAGVALSYADIVSDSFSHRHEALAHILQINYCRAGQIVWNMKDGGSIFLNPGDFSLHTLDVCADSTVQFPTGQYQGLTISVDLQEASVHPPGPIAEAEIFPDLLRDKFCPNHAPAFLAGNEQTEHIFAAFYGQPEKLRLPYRRVKALDLFLYLARMEFAPRNELTEYPPEQVAIVREIHSQLLRHMERRSTIEELSKQYLINPTTLKSVFKAVYGASLAAHIKEHRMEQAAKMLRETDMSIAAIAQAVGYESQSKFTAAFKNRFAALPTAYRKQS
jgi:AraC-like DNA-binding protein